MNDYMSVGNEKFYFNKIIKIEFKKIYTFHSKNDIDYKPNTSIIFLHYGKYSGKTILYERYEHSEKLKDSIRELAKTNNILLEEERGI